MRNVLAIFRKELRSYFASPTAYVVTAVFLAVNGFVFWLNMSSPFAEAALRGVLGFTVVVLIFLAPVLAMRLLAEEQGSGTIELLLTSPVRDFEVVLGKYLASIGLLLAMLALTLFYPALLFIYGEPDMGPLLSGYLGVFLIGAAFLAVGLLTSSFTRNQIVAAVVAIGVLLIFWFLNGAASYIGAPADAIFRYLSISTHIDDLARGIIDTKDIVYYLSFIVVFLFITVRSLETRRWR